MKRWLLPVALLLSVGFNLGLLTSFLMDRKMAVPEPVAVANTSPPEVLAPEEGSSPLLARPADPIPGEPSANAEAEPSVPPMVLAPTSSGREAASAPPESSSSQETASGASREAAPSNRPAAPVQEASEQDRPVVRPAAAASPATAQADPTDSPKDNAQPQVRRPLARSGQLGDGVRRRPSQQVEFEKMAERLGLEGAQRDRFLSDHLDFTAKVRQIGPRMLRLRRQFFRELSAEQPDEDRIKRLTQQLGVANVALERALADVILKTRRHLDKAQQQAYLRFVQGRMDRIQEFVRRGGTQQRPGAGPGVQRQRQRQQNPGSLRQRLQNQRQPDPPGP